MRIGKGLVDKPETRDMALCLVPPSKRDVGFEGSKPLSRSAERQGVRVGLWCSPVQVEGAACRIMRVGGMPVQCPLAAAAHVTERSSHICESQESANAQRKLRGSSCSSLGMFTNSGFGRVPMCCAEQGNSSVFVSVRRGLCASRSSAVSHCPAEFVHRRCQ